jgi:hypothetical protein
MTARITWPIQRRRFAFITGVPSSASYVRVDDDAGGMASSGVGNLGR